MTDSNEPIAKRLRSNRRGTVTSIHVSSVKPKNSMLKLDDKCLQKLFAHLDIETLCDMANVCQRFRTNAEQYFAENHSNFEFKGLGCKNSVFRRMLCKFGRFIKSIDACDAHFNGNQRIDINAIAHKQYGLKQLKELSLSHATIDCDVMKPIFARLVKLNLDMCEFTGNKTTLFANCAKLEHLGFDSCDSCDFVAQQFPKLVGLSFDCFSSASLTFFKLLGKNPQIKYLQIIEMPQDNFISATVTCTNNLERLCIQPGLMGSMPEVQTKQGLLRLAELKKLKKLTLNAGYETYAKLVGPLVQALSQANIALDELELSDFEINSMDINSIANVKTLEVLILNKIESVNEANLIALTTELPLLNTLHLYFGHELPEPITENGLIKMVKNAKQMECLAIVRVRNLKIDKQVFDSLLKAIQGKGERKTLIIQIVGCAATTSFDVPKSVQQANATHLKIEYEKSEYCECELCDASEEESTH